MVFFFREFLNRYSWNRLLILSSALSLAPARSTMWVSRSCTSSRTATVCCRSFRRSTGWPTFWWRSSLPPLVDAITMKWVFTIFFILSIFTAHTCPQKKQASKLTAPTLAFLLSIYARRFPSNRFPDRHSWRKGIWKSPYIQFAFSAAIVPVVSVRWIFPLFLSFGWADRFRGFINILASNLSTGFYLCFQ